MKIQFKVTVLMAIFLFSFKGIIAQEELNNYKYVIVSEQFNCQKKANLYRLNELTQFLLKKQNFEVFLASETLPDELSKNNCLALFTDVVEEKNMFRTKLKVVFKDCKNKVVFKSALGDSREKEFKKSYTEALRNAIKTFSFFKHNYKVKKPVEEVSKTEHEVEDIEVAPSTKQEIVKPKTTTPSIKQNVLKEELTTKEVFNGYQLIDKESNLVMTIYNSGVENVFIVKGKDAIIYKKGNGWIYSETNDQNLLTKIINIKF